MSALDPARAKIAALERDPRYGAGVLMVIGGGASLSLSGLMLRSLEAAGAWQILFYRSLFMVLVVFTFLALRHRGRVLAPLLGIGRTGLLVALLLSIALGGFVHAALLTTIANVVFTLGASPLIAALLGYWVLGERIRRSTAVAIAAVILGIGLMVGDGLALGRLSGNLVALGITFAFASQIILLRRARAVEMVPAAGLAAVLLAVLSALAADGLSVSRWDLLMTALLGLNTGVGFILITMGARYVPAAEVALYSLAEAVLAPGLVWVFVNEVPSGLTMAGGSVVLSAVAATALIGLREERKRARAGASGG